MKGLLIFDTSAFIPVDTFVRLLKNQRTETKHRNSLDRSISCQENYCQINANINKQKGDFNPGGRLCSSIYRPLLWVITVSLTTFVYSQLRKYRTLQTEQWSSMFNAYKHTSNKQCVCVEMLFLFYPVMFILIIEIIFIVIIIIMHVIIYCLSYSTCKDTLTEM